MWNGLPFCWLLLVLTQMSHFVHSGQNVPQGRKPSPNVWCIFFTFSQGILAQLVCFSYNSLSNGVILLSFPKVLKYSMCWLSQLNESEFIYKLLCFDFFFFLFLCSSLLCLKDRKLFVEGKHINSVMEYNKEQLVKNVLLVYVEPKLFLFLSCLATQSINRVCSGLPLWNSLFFCL